MVLWAIDLMERKKNYAYDVLESVMYGRQYGKIEKGIALWN